jgi:hypothetical protein
MKFKALALAGIAVAMFSIPAFAHHSFAMFDAEKKMTLDGTVKEFQWTNPHSWILMTVNNEQWAIEMGAPGGLARQGWVPKTLTPGMKIQAIIHPLKDGTQRRAVHGGHASGRHAEGQPERCSRCERRRGRRLISFPTA